MIISGLLFSPYIVFLFALSSYSPPDGHSGWFEVKLLKIVDGDTIYVSNNRWGQRKSHLKIRLAHIDAPELKQKNQRGERIGHESQQFLWRLLKGRRVQIRILKKDFFKRFIGMVKIAHEDINLALVQNGFAVLYPYTRFLSLQQKLKYLGAQERARLQGLGLWRSKTMKPWKYRKKLKRRKKRRP